MDLKGEMVELTKCENEASAYVIVAALEREGVPAFVTGGHLKNAHLFFALSLRPSVMVRSTDLARATELLKATQQALSAGAADLDPNWEDDAERMPREDGDQ